MVRNEKTVRKEESDLKVLKKVDSEKYSRKELDDIIIKLAEVHGIKLR